MNDLEQAREAAKHEARVSAELARLDSWNRRALDRIDGLERRFERFMGEIDERFEKYTARFETYTDRMEKKMGLLVWLVASMSGGIAVITFIGLAGLKTLVGGAE